MEVQLTALLGKNDRPTNQPTDMKDQSFLNVFVVKKIAVNYVSLIAYYTYISTMYLVSRWHNTKYVTNSLFLSDLIVLIKREGLIIPWYLVYIR